MTKISRTLKQAQNSDFFGNRAWVDPTDTPSSTPEELFLGQCLGVRITSKKAYERDDKVYGIEILCEDDGHWFPLSGSVSSGWATELANIMEAVLEWFVMNADPFVVDGNTYGWKVRTK